MDLLDVLISTGIIVGVFAFIYRALRLKHPKLIPALDKLKPGSLYIEPPKIKQTEEIKQIWTDNRSMI